MSALYYGSLTSRRLAAPPPVGAESGEATTAKSEVKPFVAAMAAIVPAEVLAAHAAIIGLVSTTEKDAAGKLITKVGYPNYVTFAFYALLVIAAGLYLLGRKLTSQALRPIDFVLMLIPPAAFTVWAMLQPATALDVVTPSFQVPGPGCGRDRRCTGSHRPCALGGVRAESMAPKNK